MAAQSKFNLEGLSHACCLNRELLWPPSYYWIFFTSSGSDLQILVRRLRMQAAKPIYRCAHSSYLSDMHTYACKIAFKMLCLTLTCGSPRPPAPGPRQKA